METKIALLGIIVEDLDSSNKVNSILHEFSDYIVGRMGIPYRERKVSVISVVIDAPQSVISAISGKLGMVEGINVKTVNTKK